MKSILTLFFLSACSFLAISQEHTSHCEHQCVVEKEAVGPFYSPSKRATNSRFSTNGRQHFIGSTHQHSGYSDGYPGTTPADYFDRGRENGFDFVLGADHSDFYSIPLTLHDACLSADVLDCISIDLSNPVGSLFKWANFKSIAANRTEEGEFVGVRGFEWTSDRFGHINVYFSDNITNAKTDGGYVYMPIFWTWFTTEPIEIPGLDMLFGSYGGGDGLGVFNHPGDKSLFDEDPGFNWNQFEYVPEADSQMVGIEVFNDGRDYGADGRTYYQEVLDAGWHVGAMASEDHHGTDWSNDQTEKSVMVAENLNTEGLKEAMYKRSMYAVRDFDLRMEFFAGKAFMGSRLKRKTATYVQLMGNVKTQHGFYTELVSSGNVVLETFYEANFAKVVEVTENEKWYYLRVVDASTGKSMAYSSPIWIEGGGDIDDNPTTSIQDSDHTQPLLIAPNPVRNGERITILSSSRWTQIQISTIDGRLVYEQQDENITEINASGLSAGVYMLYATSALGNKQHSQKLMVE
tara:strand:- start:416089 stop:417645 length:1557 start_codon:yes stop_codon:yes gene_type:complete